MDTELLHNLQQVRQLAMLGQQLQPNPATENIRGTGAGREIHSRLRDTETRLRELAETAGAFTVNAYVTPDLSHIQRELNGLQAVIAELNESIGPGAAARSYGAPSSPGA